MRRHNANQNTVSVFIFFSKNAAPHTLLVNKLVITNYGVRLLRKQRLIYLKIS